MLLDILDDSRCHRKLRELYWRFFGVTIAVVSGIFAYAVFASYLALSGSLEPVLWAYIASGGVFLK